MAITGHILVTNDNSGPISVLPKFQIANFWVGSESHFQERPVIRHVLDVVEFVVLPKWKRANSLINTLPSFSSWFKAASGRIADARVLDF